MTSDNNHDLWESFKYVSKACEELCRYRENRNSDVNTWRWNSGMKDVELNKKIPQLNNQKTLKKPKLHRKQLLRQ